MEITILIDEIIRNKSDQHRVANNFSATENTIQLRQASNTNDSDDGVSDKFYLLGIYAATLMIKLKPRGMNM